MAPDEPSPSRRRRRSSREPSAASMIAGRAAASLAEIVEQERGELMQIHAMIRCLSGVLLHADDDDSPMHADVARLVARLLDDSVARLEIVRVRVAQLEQAAKDGASSPPYQVREPRVSYLC